MHSFKHFNIKYPFNINCLIHFSISYHHSIQALSGDCIETGKSSKSQLLFKNIPAKMSLFNWDTMRRGKPHEIQVKHQTKFRPELYAGCTRHVIIALIWVANNTRRKCWAKGREITAKLFAGKSIKDLRDWALNSFNIQQQWNILVLAKWRRGGFFLF